MCVVLYVCNLYTYVHVCMPADVLKYIHARIEVCTLAKI